MKSPGTWHVSIPHGAARARTPRPRTGGTRSCDPPSARLHRGTYLAPVAEEKKEILERLGQKEGLHLAIVPTPEPRHVKEPRIASVQPAVRLEGQKDGPAPLAVSRLTSEPPQNEQGFHRLRPEEVVARIYVRGNPGSISDMRDLWCEPCRLLYIHPITRLHEAFSEFHLLACLGCVGRVGRDAVPVDAGMHTERQHARDEADEVVHLVIVAASVVVPLSDVCAIRAAVGTAPPHHVVAHALNGLSIHGCDARVGAAGHDPLLQQVLVERVGARAEGDRPAGKFAGLDIERRCDMMRWAAASKIGWPVWRERARNSSWSDPTSAMLDAP
eukprot:scaffold93880_cov29-Tisochrysis_lutea.AAC.2